MEGIPRFDMCKFFYKYPVFILWFYQEKSCFSDENEGFLTFLSFGAPALTGAGFR